MRLNATEFKAKCLAIIDRVAKTREPVTITKHGRVVARLVPEVDTSTQPWRALRGRTVVWHGDPFEPAVSGTDIEALE